MLRLLEDLLEEVRQIPEDQLLDEPVDVQENEIVLGELSPIQKRILTWVMMKEREYSHIAGALLAGTARDDTPEAIQCSKAGAMKAVIIPWLFASIRNDLNSWNSDIGIRKGWKVVEFKNPPDPVEEFFRGLRHGI